MERGSICGGCIYRTKRQLNVKTFSGKRHNCIHRFPHVHVCVCIICNRMYT